MKSFASIVTFFGEIFELCLLPSFSCFNLDFLILKSKEPLKNEYLELRFFINIILTQGQVWIINIYFLYVYKQINKKHYPKIIAINTLYIKALLFNNAVQF